jgi:diguanylate cyclase (GGDEF)-like protein
MINQLFKWFFVNKTKGSLSKEQEDIILHNIEIINLKRLKVILITLLVIEFLFIIFVDIPNFATINVNATWSDKRYFILHLLLSIVACIGIILVKRLIKKDKGEQKAIYKIVTSAFIIIILVLISIINGLDQIKIGYTSSVFIATLLICCAVILINFPLSIIVYLIPFTSFITCLVIFQKDPRLLNSNVINGSIYFIAVLIISKEFYNGQYDQMANNLLLKESNKKLDYLSSHDPLTGLSNRRNFEIHAQQKMELISEYKRESAIILIDIDYFKNINDKFGHPTGDIVLKEVSNIFIENIKDADLATRWGGEEFLILLLQTSINEAYELADKIRLIIEKKIIIIGSSEINLTASFGIAHLKGNFSASFDASYKLADKALYQAKRQGRNQVVIAPLTTEV